MSHPDRSRGAGTNPHNRFAHQRTEAVDDGWLLEIDALPKLETRLTAETARSIITRNRSPDIGIDQSINPYRGCEHGCVYCFARPSHAYLDLSPGLDFETRLFYKSNAVELLEAELRKSNYRCRPLALGINTDAYQPIERELGITRRLLEVLLAYRHPVSLLTKGITILRDLDLLEKLASHHLVSVSVSLTTLDSDLKRRLEPRTASPSARLRIVTRLREIGIRPGVMVAPIIPAINDHEIEDLLAAASEAGAVRAGYVVLRLPHELKALFADWLQVHYPDRAEHVMSLMRQLHGGKAYDSRFGQRMTGNGAFADLIARRFKLAKRRHKLLADEDDELNTRAFRVPESSGTQLNLL